jgi:hypothetical protein
MYVQPGSAPVQLYAAPWPPPLARAGIAAPAAAATITMPYRSFAGKRAIFVCRITSMSLLLWEPPFVRSAQWDFPGLVRTCCTHPQKHGDCARNTPCQTVHPSGTPCVYQPRRGRCGDHTPPPADRASQTGVRCKMGEDWMGRSPTSSLLAPSREVARGSHDAGRFKFNLNRARCIGFERRRFGSAGGIQVEPRQSYPDWSRQLQVIRVLHPPQRAANLGHLASGSLAIQGGSPGRLSEPDPPPLLGFVARRADFRQPASCLEGNERPTAPQRTSIRHLGALLDLGASIRNLPNQSTLALVSGQRR